MEVIYTVFRDNYTQTVLLNYYKQETHRELAERTGKYVVEFRPEEGNRPRIVATPSERSILRQVSEEEDKQGVEDITVHFDPYRGAHKPKTAHQIQGTHPNLMSDIAEH